VTINDVSANKAGIDKLVEDLNSKHGANTAIGVVADVTNSSEVQSMISQTVSSFGAVHVMVANAGIAQVAPSLDISDEDVQRMFNVNFMGVWNCYTHAARQMIKQGNVGEGEASYKILGAASIVAFKPFPLLSHYSASKWAVRGFTQVFAMVSLSLCLDELGVRRESVWRDRCANNDRKWRSIRFELMRMLRE
jgi:NAD(P)-dependent dehydrogenase (short-subunit alcohol dehydrogenase family)